MPLDIFRQNAGLRPVGIGEFLRRIAGKVIVLVLKEDVIKFTGMLQVRAGQEVSIEAAFYSMNMIYEDENTGAILLADASNAFNSLNHFS